MHQENVLKFISMLVIILICFTLLTSIVAADGFAIKNQPEILQWSALDQEKQIGIINFRDGYEKLIIVIDVKNSSLTGEQAAWIVPIPADPANVTIDILDDIPTLSGSRLQSLARDAVAGPYFFFYSTQPYMIPFAFLNFYIDGIIAGGYSDENQYTIYESIEEKGVTTEKIGAKDSQGFQIYLQSHNLTLPDEANETIDDYIGQDYCFIVSWISNIEEFREEALIEEYYNYDYYYSEPFFMLGISINFPTEKIYYPLKLTSIYGSATIPIFIQVMDYVTPVQYPDVSQYGYMVTQYYIDTDYRMPTSLTTFFAEQLEQSSITPDVSEQTRIPNLRYTKIRIYSEAQFLTEDLWIDDMASAETSILDLIATNGWIVLLAIFILSSCIASLLAGLRVFHKQKPIIHKFALLGLCNLASLLGMFIASFSLRIDQKFVENPINEKKIKSKVPIKWIGIGVGITFLILLLLSFCFFSIPSALSVFMWSTIFIGPIVGIIAMFVYGAYKDKQKTVFVLFFSMIFVVILFLTQIIIRSFL